AEPAPPVRVDGDVLAAGVCAVLTLPTGPRVLGAFEPNVAGLGAESLRDRMRPVGILRAVQASPSKKCGELGDADPEDLLGENVVDTDHRAHRPSCPAQLDR